MARSRTSSQVKTQIQELLSRGFSKRAVARALGISRKTLRKFESPPKEDAQPEEEGWSGSVDWKEVVRERARGVTIKQLHAEHAPEVTYFRFRRALQLSAPKTPTDVTMRLQHKPGEMVQIDFDEGLPIVNPETGETTRTWLFCGVLPFSGYVYGEFVTDQKLPTFLRIQDHMWDFFGGVTPYLVVDNLKSGVKKAHLYDPEINPTYCDYANHTGFAVLPARPRTPRDKAAVENIFSVIERQFFQENRKSQFASLSALNDAFRWYLADLNAAAMKDYGVSRKERFAGEKEHLLERPATPFELREWKVARVHPDCHIQLERNFYSVPWNFVGQNVRVRHSDSLVEVFTAEGDAIAAHARVFGLGKFFTQEKHYPEEKVSVARFEIRHAKEKAARIGESTRELLDTLFAVPHPLKYLRFAQGLLRLVEGERAVPVEALEFACAQALVFRKFRLAYIRACAENWATCGGRPKLAAPIRDPNHCHLATAGEQP